MLQPAQTLTGTNLPLGAAIQDLLIADIGFGPVLHALNGNGLTALSIAPGGTLATLDTIAHATGPLAGVPPRLMLAGGPLLFRSGTTADGTAIGLDSGGYGAVSGVSGLAAPLVAPARVSIAGADYIIAALPGSGLIAYRETAPAVLVEAFRLDVAGDAALASVGATAALPGGDGRLVALSPLSHAVTTLRAGPDGALTVAARASAADGLGLSLPSEIAAVTVGGETFAVVGSPGSAALTVFAVAPDGALRAADHVIDSLASRFNDVSALAALEVGAFGFVAAGGSDDGVSLFTLMPDGRLVHLDAIADTTSTALTNTDALALTTTGGQLQVLAGGTAGLTRLTYDISDLGTVTRGGAGPDVLAGTGGRDILWGGDGNDTLSGGGGRDLIADGGGADLLSGGAGADIFVLSGDGVSDRIIDFNPAEDRLDLSGWRFFYDPSQLALSSGPTGWVVTFRAEELVIVTTGLQPLTPGILAASILPGPDRPPMFLGGQSIAGTSASDLLPGGLGADTIEALGGADTVLGGDGADNLLGGTGEDVLEGGPGGDSLQGDGGFDTLYGGTGDDTLDGGLQADRLFGGDGDDRLIGGDGTDNLYGDAGRDRQEGGNGNDRLWGGSGNDTLFGGFQEDRLFGEDGDDLLLGDGGFDALEGGPGDDTMNGGGQADNLFGGPGNDRLLGEGGFDRLFGSFDQDTLLAGEGDDALFGEGGDDVLDGQGGDDRLNGGPGNDLVEGNIGNDALRGGAGFDTLFGGAGNDTLTGDFNADTFVFADGFGTDLITDFAATNLFERIDLTGVSAIDSWADLSANHIVQDGADIRITAGPDTLTLAGVAFADLDPGDFVF